MFEKTVIKFNDKINNLSSFKDSSSNIQQQNNQQTKQSNKKNTQNAQKLKIAIFRFSTKLDQLHRESENPFDFQNMSRKFSKNEEKIEKIHNTNEIKKKKKDLTKTKILSNYMEDFSKI